MKKLFGIFGMVVLVISLFSAMAPAEPIVLRMAIQNPEPSWGTMHATKPWIDMVEKATNGQVKIQAFYAQTLTKGVDTWNAVKNGIADIGWCFHGYWPGLTPLADVMSLPGIPFGTAEKGSEVFWKMYEKFPAVQKEFKDVQVLLLYTSAPYFCATRDTQVKTMADLKGLKMRVTGGPPTTQMKVLGGVPMLIGMPDVYMSLQKGVIDGMECPWEAVQAFRLYEVLKYFSKAPFPAVYFSISANKAKWNSLPKEAQDAIMSVSGLKGSKFWGLNWFDTAKDAVFKEAKDSDHEMIYYELPEEEWNKWVDLSVKPIWDSWVKDMEGKGFTDAKAILDAAVGFSK